MTEHSEESHLDKEREATPKDWEADFNRLLDEDGAVDYDRLSTEQLEALAAGPGKVQELSPQLQFTDQYDFEGHISNFPQFFTEGMYADGKRSVQPAYQRFAILCPEFNQYLLTHEKLDYLTPEYGKDILAAYKIMSHLVDAKEDPARDSSSSLFRAPEEGSRYLRG